MDRTYSKATAGVGYGEPPLEGAEGAQRKRFCEEPEAPDRIRTQGPTGRVDPELRLTDLEVLGDSGRWMFAACREVGLRRKDRLPPPLLGTENQKRAGD